MSRRPQAGVVRAWDGKVGWIRFQRNAKNLRFELADLRGIERPEVGARVAFYRKGQRAVIVRSWKPVPASQAEQGKDDLA